MIDKTKIKVLNKLFDNGYTTEKKICEFGIEDLPVTCSYAPYEINTIIELKEAVKKNRLITYLSGIEQEE